MEYKFALEKQNYEDLSSGRVLYNAQGTTSFPVRLASEIIQRCFKILTLRGKSGPYTVYDPCCGGGYLLTIAGFLHGEQIDKIYASDIEHRAVDLAEKNLSLLSPNGLQTRTKQLELLHSQFEKESHRAAIQSATNLSSMLSEEINIKCFVNDITAPNMDILKDLSEVNIVISDFPYGDIASWRTRTNDPIGDFFNSVYNVLDRKNAVVAVVANEKIKLNDSRYKRVDYFKNGKRHVGIYELLNME